MLPAIILAAGESRRMGQLKPLITINGKTFLLHIVDELTRAGITKIYVVVGYRAEIIIRESKLTGAEFIINEKYQQGQFSSLQAGIRQLEQGERGVIVCLGDQPQIKAQWIFRLMEAFNKNDPLIVVPKFQGKRGHPIIYSSRLFSEILSMSPTQTAHALSKNHADKIQEVEMEDRGILLDADKPEDLETLRGEFFV